jgi:hypothetical protein
MVVSQVSLMNINPYFPKRLIGTLVIDRDGWDTWDTLKRNAAQPILIYQASFTVSSPTFTYHPISCPLVGRGYRIGFGQG